MLEWSLADLDGDEFASIEQRDVGANVMWPLGGHRTASVTISLFDDVARQLVGYPYRGCLSTVLRVTYDDDPIFAGLVVPAFSGSSGKVTLNAFGASWRLERAFLHADTGDLTYDQGEMIYQAIDRVRPSAGDLAAGIRDIPIKRGSVVATRQRTKAWTAGSSAWQNIDQIVQLFDGPELDWRPLHESGPYFCALDIYQRLGQDHSDDVVFVDGDADQNALIDLEPGGDATVNYATALGQTSDEAAAPQQVSEWPEGERAIGRYEAWLGASDTSETAVLKALAQQQVMAYGAPPEFVKITPAIERDVDRGYQVAPKLTKDYDVGDTVTVASNVGALDVELHARIKQATLREVDSAGNIRTDLEAVPQVFRGGVT